MCDVWIFSINIYIYRDWFPLYSYAKLILFVMETIYDVKNWISGDRDPDPPRPSSRNLQAANPADNAGFPHSLEFQMAWQNILSYRLNVPLHCKMIYCTFTDRYGYCRSDSCSANHEAVKKKDCLERWNVECVNSQSRNLALKKCTEDPTWTSSLFVWRVESYDIHLQIISRIQFNSN